MAKSSNRITAVLRFSGNVFKYRFCTHRAESRFVPCSLIKPTGVFLIIIISNRFMLIKIFFGIYLKTSRVFDSCYD